MKSHNSFRMEGFSPFYVMELLQRAKELESEGKNIIHMEIGESDMLTPDRIVNAGIKFLTQKEVKYTSAAGLIELRYQVAEYYRQTYNIVVAPERIFITPGASGALLLALSISLNEGDEIIMADPCYPCNDNFVRLLGGRTKFVNVSTLTNFQLTASLVQKNWTLKTKGVLVASPSNPTGTIMSAGDLEQVINQVSAFKGYFYSDEIYHGLVYDQKAHSALEFSSEVFVINSFSKYFAMTGWRIGWVVVPEAFIDAAERFAQNIFISTATHSQYAAIAAFSEENLIELDCRKKEFKKRRDFLYSHLIRLGFGIEAIPEGAFYIYANCSHFTDDSFQFAKDLLEQEGVAVTPGKDFGKNNENCYIRFAYTVSIDKMTLAIERLERFLCQ